jgi:hypothetical protein
MVVRDYRFMALKKLQAGTVVSVTEEGVPFGSSKYVRVFTVEKGEDDKSVIRFNGVIYEFDEAAHKLKPCGEYSPYEGLQGALWE